MMSLKALVAVLTSLAALVHLPGTSAQSTNATCAASYKWADNSLSQSPCLVAAYLEGVCNGGEFNISALTPGYHYLGPTAEFANECQCNTVTYSLVSACADCQGQEFDVWSVWSFNCTTVYSSNFPENIPGGTAIPAWAYLNVVASDTYNAAAAEADLGAPDSTALPKQTGTVTVSPPKSSSAAFPPSSSSSAPLSKTSNAGAIAGGVVGGIAAVAIIAALFIWFRLRRRNSRTSETLPFEKDPGSPPPTNPHTPTYENSTFYTNSTSPPPKLYNPSDPSTFPAVGAAPDMSTNQGSVNMSSLHAQGGQYSGVPEV